MHRHLTLFVVVVFSFAIAIVLIFGLSRRPVEGRRENEESAETMQEIPIKVAGEFKEQLNDGPSSTSPSPGEGGHAEIFKGTNEITDELDSWVPPLMFTQNYSYYQAGHDLDKRPIWIAELGKWNMPDLVKKGKEAMKMFEKYAAQGLRKAAKSINESNTLEHPVCGVMLIIDMDGFQLMHLTDIPSFQFMVKLLKDYDQLLEYIQIGFMVNTNTIAQLSLNVIKPLLGPLMSRIEIYGTNKNQWIPQLHKYCDRTQVPQQYGGTWSTTNL